MKRIWRCWGYSSACSLRLRSRRPRSLASRCSTVSMGISSIVPRLPRALLRIGRKKATMKAKLLITGLLLTVGLFLVYFLVLNVRRRTVVVYIEPGLGLEGTAKDSVSVDPYTAGTNLTATVHTVNDQLASQQNKVPPEQSKTQSANDQTRVPLDILISSHLAQSEVDIKKAHSNDPSNPLNQSVQGTQQAVAGTHIATSSTLAKDAPDWLTDSCEDMLCLKYLSPADASHFRRMSFLTSSPPGPNPRCHFMDGKGRDPVGLVSVPGSGNTWVRGVLERATGICTGSIYTDEPLRLGGFLGEYVQGGSVLVVKSHTSDFQWKDEAIEARNYEDALYGSAIVLVRNPFDTFVSERNRVVSLYELRGYWPNPPSKIDASHTRLVDKSNFGNNTKWETFIHAIGERWVKTINKWVVHPTSRRRKVMILRYEDFKKDKLSEVKRILNFINFPFDEETVRQRLENEFSTFHREYKEEFEHYTVGQKKWMNNILLETIEMLQKHGLEDEFRLHEYIDDL